MQQSDVHVNKGNVKVKQKSTIYVRSLNVYTCQHEAVTEEDLLKELAIIKRELAISKREAASVEDSVNELKINLTEVLASKRKAAMAATAAAEDSENAYAELSAELHMFKQQQLENDRDQQSSTDDLRMLVERTQHDLMIANDMICELSATLEYTRGDLRSARLGQTPLLQAELQNQASALSRYSLGVRTLLHMSKPLIFYAILLCLAYLISMSASFQKFVGLALGEVLEFGMDSWVFLCDRRSKRLLAHIH